MEKEELKKLKEWCEVAAAAVNTLSAVKKMAPESIVLISEFPTDKEVHVFSDIEKISEALNQPICFETRRGFSEKRVAYGEVTFFQIENHEKE